MEAANIKTRKFLTMKSTFYPQYNIQRQVEGIGRGLESGKTIVLNECIQELAYKDKLIWKWLEKTSDVDLLHIIYTLWLSNPFKEASWANQKCICAAYSMDTTACRARPNEEKEVEVN